MLLSVGCCVVDYNDIVVVYGWDFGVFTVCAAVMLVVVGLVVVVVVVRVLQVTLPLMMVLFVLSLGYARLVLC